MIEQKIANSIKKSIKSIQKKYALGKIPEFIIERPKKESFGDYATNAAIILGRSLNKNPMGIGKDLVSKIKKDKSIYPHIFEKIELVKPGFINFTLSKEFLQKHLLEIQKTKKKFDWQEIGKKKTVIIDYSSPNIAKPMHVGHLRSTIIGQSLYNIYKFLGYKVIGDNHIGDWGTQFGKLIYAYKNWGDKKKIDKSPIREMTKLYVRFHKESEKDEKLEEFARMETKKLQDKDKENIKIWKFLVKESLKDFNKIYKLLGIKFDYVLGESFYDPMLESVVNDALKKKVACLSQGAVIIPLEKYSLPAFLIRKSDNAFLYATGDLAAIKWRLNKFKPWRIIYVVSNEQTLYFQQLFQSAELLKLTSKDKLVHIKFGMVLGKDKKKFSTRKGEAIALEELIEKAIRLARKVVEEKNPKLSKTEKEKIAKVVGIGAIKYNDLSQNRLTDISFNWDKMLNLQGNSAPYLQYTHARIKSILRKSPFCHSGLVEGSQFNPSLLKNKLEISLLRQLLFFPETVERAAREYSPNIIADYIYKLATRFNLFYTKIPVLKAEKNLCQARLNLISAIAIILKKGLALLGIEAPEKM